MEDCGMAYPVVRLVRLASTDRLPAMLPPGAICMTGGSLRWMHPIYDPHVLAHAVTSWLRVMSGESVSERWVCDHRVRTFGLIREARERRWPNYCW